MFRQVVQKQMLGELKIWIAIWCLFVSEMFILKTINYISLIFSSYYK